MTTFTSLLDHLYEGDIVDTSDLARVSDTNPRSVARWKAEAATPRRDAEERGSVAALEDCQRDLLPLSRAVENSLELRVAAKRGKHWRVLQRMNGRKPRCDGLIH